MNVSKVRVVIRSAREGDLDALVELENHSFVTDLVSREQYRRHLESRTAIVLVARYRRRLVGSALIFLRRRNRRARLYSIAIDRDSRGLGIGGKLLRAAEKAAAERGRRWLYLEVRDDNAAAISLYEKRGYVRGETIEGFYEDGADARRYEKKIA